MGRRVRLVAALAAAAALCAASARAAVQLETLSWQRQAPAARGIARSTETISELDLAQGAGAPARFGGSVRLLNRGPADEGILLRYSVAAKLAPVSGGAPAVWAVPYLLDERRVPRIGPNQYAEVPLDAAALTDLYLKKLYREGYRPVALRLEVMLEPRRGEPPGLQLLSAELPVVAAPEQGHPQR